MKIPEGKKDAQHTYKISCLYGVCRGISIKTKTDKGNIDLYVR